MFEKFRTRANPKLFYVRFFTMGGEGKKKKREKEDTIRKIPEEREAKVSTRIENLEKPYGNLSHFCIMRKVGVEYTHLEWKNKVIHSGI